MQQGDVIKLLSTTSPMIVECVQQSERKKGRRGLKVSRVKNHTAVFEHYKINVLQQFLDTEFIVNWRYESHVKELL